MKKTYLICDESGAKGFSDNDEKFEGEFGIFAGYLVTEENFEKMKSEFQCIYEKYETDTGKLHITDLEKTNQENLRNEVFAILISNDIPIVYEAISVRGYKINSDMLSKLKNDNIEKLKDDFSFSKNIDLTRLHSDLFEGIFGKFIAHSIDTFGENEEIQLEVITDNIDKQLKKEFEGKAKELIAPFPSSSKVKAFDKNNKKPISKKIKFSSQQLDNDSISKIKFEIKVQDDALTLIADILANSLYYFIKQELNINVNINLNSNVAIAKYPLLKQIYGLSTKTNVNIVSDIIYRRESSNDNEFKI